MAQQKKQQMVQLEELSTQLWNCWQARPLTTHHSPLTTLPLCYFATLLLATHHIYDVTALLRCASLLLCCSTAQLVSDAKRQPRPPKTDAQLEAQRKVSLGHDPHPAPLTPLALTLTLPSDPDANPDPGPSL